MHASIRGHTAVAKTLLAAGASVDLQNAHGTNALILAAAHGATPIAAALLAAGASVDLTGTDGATALMRAAEESHAYVVDLLLKAGANAALKDKAERKTALDWARSRAGADEGHQVQALLRAAAAAKEL